MCLSLNLLAAEYKPVVDLFAALLTPAIACIVAYVALQQKKIAVQQKEIARNKLKLDLFDRRIKLYEEIENFFSPDFQGNQEDLLRFLGVQTKSVFIFDDSIKLWLDEVYKMLINLHAVKERLKDRSLSQSQRASHIDKEVDLERCLLNESKSMPQRFAEHMKIEAS